MSFARPVRVHPCLLVANFFYSPSFAPLRFILLAVIRIPEIARAFFSLFPVLRRSPRSGGWKGGGEGRAARGVEEAADRVDAVENPFAPTPPNEPPPPDSTRTTPLPHPLPGVPGRGSKVARTFKAGRV